MAKKKPARKKPAPKKISTKTSTKRVPPKKAPARRAAAPRSQPRGPRVVHWEVQARDLAGQQRFFGDLFGWTINANNPMRYGMVSGGGADSIGGGIGETSDAPRTTFYVQVSDINATLAKAQSMGAETIMPRTDAGMVVMAQFRDPEGNVIGLVEGP
jgi:predicted enzyme related to lactoylglutathione lyase